MPDSPGKYVKKYINCHEHYCVAAALSNSQSIAGTTENS
jgi:hypothetical protein